MFRLILSCVCWTQTVIWQPISSFHLVRCRACALHLLARASYSVIVMSAQFRKISMVSVGKHVGRGPPTGLVPLQ